MKAYMEGSKESLSALLCTGISQARSGNLTGAIKSFQTAAAEAKSKGTEGEETVRVACLLEAVCLLEEGNAEAALKVLEGGGDISSDTETVREACSAVHLGSMPSNSSLGDEAENADVEGRLGALLEESKPIEFLSEARRSLNTLSLWLVSLSREETGKTEEAVSKSLDEAERGLQRAYALSEKLKQFRQASQKEAEGKENEPTDSIWREVKREVDAELELLSVETALLTGESLAVLSLALSEACSRMEADAEDTKAKAKKRAETLHQEACRLLKEALKACEASEVDACKELLPAVLGAVAHTFAGKNEAVAAEGLFRNALERFDALHTHMHSHHRESLKFQIRHAKCLLNWSIICGKWENRESEAQAALARADGLFEGNASLPFPVLTPDGSSGRKALSLQAASLVASSIPSLSIWRGLQIL